MIDFVYHATTSAGMNLMWPIGATQGEARHTSKVFAIASCSALWLRHYTVGHCLYNNA
jgi:hypothetical protein